MDIRLSQYLQFYGNMAFMLPILSLKAYRRSINTAWPSWLCSCCILMVATGNAKAAASQRVTDSMIRIQEATTGQAMVSLDPATELASFIRFEPGDLRTTSAADASFDEITRDFLKEYGAVFGLRDPAKELILSQKSIDSYGLGHVRYRQVYQGIPVFGAELSGHFSLSGQLFAISASTIEIEALDMVPVWQMSLAEEVAEDLVASAGRQRKQLADLQSINTELVVFRTGLARGIPGNNYLAYRIEVINSARSVREFVFVNAHTGKVLDQISGINEALDRKVSETTLANVVWQDSAGDPDPITAGWAGGSAQQVTDWQNEIEGTRETYNLIASMTAGVWLSYDNADATMRTVNNDPGIACPNASWNGISTNYCSNVTGDDTVAHEWGHAYTEYTANLIYQWQSGALNESYSDVWGEVVDFMNGRGTDAPLGLRTDGSCSVYGNGPNTDDSYRWLSGEDDPAFGGAIRDMWTPTCYGDPGKVTDTQYWCNTGDSGGVHINSGVPNHGFALITDGGTFNSQTITGLGLTKASHVYWNALQMLVPASNFADQADALEVSCTSLIGVDLPALSTSVTDAGLSGEAITAGDCVEVAAAIMAVELRTEPTQCAFEPLLETDPPAHCLDRGDLQSAPLTDWEGGIGSWTPGTHNITNPGTFDTPDWAVVGSLPGARPGSAAFVADLITGDCAADDETGALTLDSPEIAIPAGTAVPRLSIDHWVATEAGWDGGNLKISVNGGAFNLIPAAAIEISPYNATLNSIGAGNTNPLAGEAAFTGNDGGSVEGSWGQSQINLSGIASAGDMVRLRFDFGVDGCNGLTGWYVDEVEFYRCSLEVPPSDCGNGVIDDVEQCDDGNDLSGDGCSSICEIEDGWECTAPIPITEIPDHSFEAGPSGGIWTESSANFGTPICDVDGCGLGGGTGPSDGSFWAWFGGIAGAVEESIVSQSVTFPASATDLTFDFELPACDSAADYLEFRIDGNTEFAVDGTDASCGSVGYVLKTVDVTAYADGAEHDIGFYSETFSSNGGATNFMVDRILFPGTPSICMVVQAPEFDSTPEAGSTLAFGSQVINTESDPLSVQVDNLGALDLTLDCLITGADESQLNLISCPTPVAMAGSTQVTVRCEPTSVGEKTASLDITTNDDDETNVSFPLTCLAVDTQQQIITPDPLTQEVTEGNPASIDVNYTTSDGDETLSGLGLRLHWDSSQLTFVDLTSVWVGDFVSADNTCQVDGSDFDGDASTDCYVNVVWNSVSSEFPGDSNTPTLLYTANFTSNVPSANSTDVNFSASAQPAGYNLSATSAMVENALIDPETIFSDGFEEQPSP